MNPMKKLNERGAVAAEFAILLPVLLLIVFGTIEFGMMMYGREVVTNATREGARYGIIAQTPAVTSGQMITHGDDLSDRDRGESSECDIFRSCLLRSDRHSGHSVCHISLSLVDSLHPNGAGTAFAVSHLDHHDHAT